MSTDVRKELEKIKYFNVDSDLSSLNILERKALFYCVHASKILNDIYLKQVCGDNLENYLKIIEKENDPDLKAFFKINAGPWNRFQEDVSFVSGIGKKPETVGFYPEDLAKDEWNRWLQENPQDKKEFESNTTIIKRNNHGLEAIPYHKFFEGKLKGASDLLFLASRKLKENSSSGSGALTEYLQEISKALTTGDYRKSDIAWVKTTGFPFEIVFGPIENYEDKFLGLKSAFEAFIGIPDIEATRSLETFKKYIPEFDAVLAKKFNYVPKGSLASMVVFNDVLRAGEAAAGRQFQAANLPNDREIHELYGSKKVFSKTIMKAKSEYLSSKIAKRVLSDEDKKNYNHDSHVLFILGHEISHGMGPAFIEKDGGRVSLEKLLGKTSLPLEEAKADVLGFTFMRYLGKKGFFTNSQLREMMLTNLVSEFIGWRTNFKGAHSQSGLIQYNYLKKHGALNYNPEQKTIAIDYEKSFILYENLANEIMTIQNQGDYEATKSFLTQNAIVQPEIKTLIDKLDGIPLEVHPVFNV